MKKLLLILSITLFFGSVSYGQELSKETKKAVSGAKKSLAGFKADVSKKDKIAAAKDEIDRIMTEMSDASKAAYSLNVKGDIYNEIASQYVFIKQSGVGNVEELPAAVSAPLMAYNSYKEALNYITKGAEEKAAYSGIAAAQNNMNQYALYYYEADDYKNSLDNFLGMLDAHDLLKGAGKASNLDDELRYEDIVYFTGVAAFSADNKEATMKYLGQLFEKKSDRAFIYQALYETAAKEDVEAAYKYLEVGREVLPDDVNLLFSEINHFLKLEKTDVLVDKLKEGIAKEPGNVSLYFTLGNIYDQLYQNSVKEGNKEDEGKYFDLAMNQYDEALKVEADYVDAIYGKGALFYNKAAGLTQELQAMDDFSTEGQKKYDAKREEVFEAFEKALPFFQKAESMDPNDVNTLIALKEIYAKKNELDISGEFAKRLETVKAGGKNESSYFNK